MVTSYNAEYSEYERKNISRNPPKYTQCNHNKLLSKHGIKFVNSSNTQAKAVNLNWLLLILTSAVTYP